MPPDALGSDVMIGYEGGGDARLYSDSCIVDTIKGVGRCFAQHHSGSRLLCIAPKYPTTTGGSVLPQFVANKLQTQDQHSVFEQGLVWLYAGQGDRLGRVR